MLLLFDDSLTHRRPVFSSWLWLGVLLLLIPQTAPADVQYDTHVIDSFDPSVSFPEVFVWDLNDQGRACTTSTYESFYGGFVWDLASGGTRIPITWPRGINNHDRVVGEALYHDLATGTSIPIPPPDAVHVLTRAQDINDDDVVVGYAEWVHSNQDKVNQVPFIWDPVNGTRSIGVLGARELLRVSASGVGVGNIRYSAGSSEAFVYEIAGGTSINLDDLLTPTGPGYSAAADINDLGVVAGEGWNGTTYNGFTWSQAEGFRFLPGLDGGDTDRVHPTGINNAGFVVGYALNGVNQWRAFIWDPASGMRDLNDLVAAPAGFVLDRAFEISHSGWIVGDGHYGPGSGLSVGFVLSLAQPVAVDEPALGVGGFGVKLAAGQSNPAVPPVRFELTQPAAGALDATVFDIRGRKVARFATGHYGVGVHSLLWHGRDDLGGRVPAGVYLIRVVSEGRSTTERVVLMR